VNSSEGGGSGAHGSGQAGCPGGHSDLAPVGQLIGQGPGAHPVESIDELRSGAFETDEELEVPRVRGRGRGTRTLPEPAGKAVVRGAHVAPGRSGRLAPRLVGRQPDPDLRACW
jgi:hypothetical protein